MAFSGVCYLEGIAWAGGARFQSMVEMSPAARIRAGDAKGYPSGPLIQVFMLTGQRRNEIAPMKRGEIDWEPCSWSRRIGTSPRLLKSPTDAEND
jgi:hypothetical protein